MLVDLNDLLDTAEVATHTGIPIGTVRRLIRQGHIQPIKRVGGLYPIFLRADADKLHTALRPPGQPRKPKT